MPGITGFITNKLIPENKSYLKLMLDSMMHESFYSSGRYIDENMGVYLGWVSLKGSFADCLPIWNEKKDKVLFFYGEDFQDRAIIERLRSNGHDFKLANASYLIHLYEEQRKDFFQFLNGFFNGILIDLEANEISLFNDRFGMQRIYYYRSDDSFYFSSEIKAILKLLPNLRVLVPESLAELCSMGCVLEDKTLFKNIYQLPGASIWTFSNGVCKSKVKYFDQECWEKQTLLEKEAFYIEYANSFKSVLPRYLNSTDQIAMSLTGGLDTRMIMANNQRPRGAFPCYTFGSMYHDSFDVKIARKVARACGQEHLTIRVDKNFIEDFDRLAEKTVYITDGYLDVTGAIELYVNKIAREVAPIRITGNYGSEVLRGIRAFKPKPTNLGFFNHDFIKHINQASDLFDESVKMHDLSFAVFKQAPWFNYNRLSIEQSQLTMRSPFMDNELLALAFRNPKNATSSDELTHRLISNGNFNLHYILTNRSVTIDSNSFPFQARKVWWEFLRLSEYCYDYGMPQWFASIDYLIKSLHPERVLLGRHKFYHFRVWYRDELADYVSGILLDSSTLNRSYFNKRTISQMVMSHISGHRNYTTEITRLLTVELIHRLFIV